jgi:hypothetical protein
MPLALWQRFAQTYRRLPIRRRRKASHRLWTRRPEAAYWREMRGALADHLHEDFTMGVIMSANLAAPFAEKWPLSAKSSS